MGRVLSFSSVNNSNFNDTPFLLSVEDDLSIFSFAYFVSFPVANKSNVMSQRMMCQSYG